MESQYAMPANAGAGPAPFFYYNPDLNAPHGQHGYFSTHPSDSQPMLHHQQSAAPYPGQWHQRQQYGQEQLQQPQPIQDGPPHAIPEANGNGQVGATAKLASNDVYSLSPTASPRPMHVKPSILLQQESSAFLSLDTSCLSSDLQCFPTTPPLSTDGSTISSPPSSCGMVRTPVNGGLFRCESIEGVKEGCEGDVESEILANCDLARSDSPPLTPVFISAFSAGRRSSHAQSSHGISHTTEGVTAGSTSASSPALSPSPSPALTSFTSHTSTSHKPSISSQPSGSDVCDPRQLTVESSLSPTSPAPADFPPLPPLSPHREADTDSDRSLASAHADSHDPCIAPGRVDHTLTSLPSFDSISGFDSEDEEFAKDVVDFAPTHNAFYLGDKRRRIEPYLPEDDDLVSEQSFDDFESDDLFARSALPLPDPDEAEDTAESTVATMKPKKRSSRTSIAKRSSMSGSDSDALNSAIRTAQDNHSGRADNTHPDSSTTQGQQQTGGSGQSTSGDNAQRTSTSNAPRPPVVPVSRRGRKQSLTDDPSKTFVCTLCSRRFRRQEHLKRHYRSLHTEEKPFECADCGKKFSRSDNLAQHARIHGTSSTTITATTSDSHDPQEVHSEATEATEATEVPTLFEQQTEAERLTDVLLEIAYDAVNKETTTEESSGGDTPDRSITEEEEEEESPTPLPDLKRPLKKRKRESA